MLNFLFELKDFKQLMKFALKPKASYNKIRNLLKRPPKSADPTRPAAGIFLTWQLAIKPLLSDLSAIHAQLATLVREKQAEFQALGSESQSSHYSELLGSEETGMTRGTKIYKIFGFNGKYHSTMYTATMHYNYAYTMRDTIDAFVRFWGLNPTAERFWNAIPFSFIVDYFIKIGDSLHAMSLDQNVELQMTDYAESLLTTVSSGTHLLPYDYWKALVLNDEYRTEFPTRPELVSGVQGSLYDRVITTPNYGPALPKLKLPSGKQTATMAALVRCLL
jgi:hypothetical protein